MDVTITQFWGHNPSSRLETALGNLQFEFQQIVSGYGTSQIDALNIYLFFPMSKSHFGDPKLLIGNLKKRKREVTLILDWKEYSKDLSHIHRVRTIAAALTRLSYEFCITMGHNEEVATICRDRVEYALNAVVRIESEPLPEPN